MKKLLSKEIKERLCPIMLENGYVLARRFPTSKEWLFEKQTTDGRTIKVIVEYLKNVITTIRLDMGIVPSQKYNSFEIDVPQIKWNGKQLEKNMYGGWTCRENSDVEIAVDYIIEIMKQFAFDYFDKAQNDPTDKPLSLDSQSELFNNHEKYELQFLSRHNMSAWIIDDVIKAMQEDLLQIINSTEADNSLILEVSAAYGKLLIHNGGKWIWEADVSKAAVQIPNRIMNTIDRIKYPLQEMMFYVRAKDVANVKEEIIGILKFTGNL